MAGRTSGCRSGAVHLGCYKCSSALRSKGVWPGRPYEAAQPAGLRLFAARDRPARRDRARVRPGSRTARRRCPARRERCPARRRRCNRRRTRRLRSRRMRRTRRAGAPTRPISSPASRRATRSTCSTTCRASPSTRATPTGAASARPRGNVLINGERFSGKSVDIFTELRRISASNVARIEIVDGATLNVPGLAGQVANVVTASTGLSGNYIWRPQIRAHRTPARLTNAEASINGTLSGTDFTLSVRNNSFRNGNAGPELVFRPDGTVLDRRDEVLSVEGEEPHLNGSIHRDFSNGTVLNLNASTYLAYTDVEEISDRSGPGQPDRQRDLKERTRAVQLRAGRRPRVRRGRRPAEADRAPPLHPHAVHPDPAPDLRRRQPDRRRPLHPECRRDRIDRPQRISLARRPRRLAGLDRGRAQPARGRQRPVHARSRRVVRAGPLPQFARGR